MSYLAWLFYGSEANESEVQEEATDEQKRARNDVLKEIRELKITKEKKIKETKPKLKMKKRVYQLFKPFMIN